MNPVTRFAVIFIFGTVSILPGLSQTPTANPIPDFLFDHDQDGDVDSQDLLLFLQKWGLEGIPTPIPSPTETPTNPNAITVVLPFPTPLPLQLIRIPAGSFMMGSPDTERSRTTDEGPIHTVTIANDFFMGQTEVTQAQWEAVMGNNPAADFGEGPNHPVYSVSWIDCQDFLLALNGLSGEGTFRLPTEAEWEYACRAGTTKRFYFGNSLGCSDGCEDCLADINVVVPAKGVPAVAPQLPSILEPKQIIPNLRFRSDFMWFCANSGILAQPVRSLRANAFGLFDMSGNVIEWVQDEYHFDYTGAPTDGSAWIGGGNGQRVHRGGAFVSTAGLCRSAKRFFGDPSFKSVNVGFRIVWTP